MIGASAPFFGDNMAKAKKISVPKNDRQPIQGIDATIRINVFAPGHEAEEFVLTIPNIVGTAALQNRKPKDIAQSIISGLQHQFGKVK